MKTPRGFIFDYGNTLVRLDPGVRSTRTDYADVVARPGAERLAAFLVREGALDVRRAAEFMERFLERRARNRIRAEEEMREIPALRSLRETLEDLGLEAPDGDHVLERAVEEHFLPEVELMRPMPGAPELLTLLRKRGLRIGMLSNATSSAYIRDVVARLGWEGWFDPLVVSSDLGIRKPRAEAFRAVLDRWDLPPGEVVMVGDSLYHDVEGARKLGLLTVHLRAIPNAFDAKTEARVPPTHAISTLDELRRLLS